jgi:hypothetical protein
MEINTFWNKNGTRQYEGHIHIGPTSATHCTSCDGGARPLARGIAVHFTDQNGRTIFATGPECFKKHTDIKNLSSIPTIGFGFADVSLGRKKTSNGSLISPSFRDAHEGLPALQQEAYANVLLRAKVLPSMGFKINQAGLVKYLDRQFPYDEGTLKEITRYVQNGVDRHQRPSLDQLCRAQYVAYQIDALSKKDLRSGERKLIKSLDESLKILFGLTDRQMKALEDCAQKYGLHLQETGIRFPENQRRLEQSQLKKDLFD